METTIIILTVLSFISSFSFLAVFIEDQASKKANKKEMSEYPLLSDEEYQLCWYYANGDEAEFHRLAAFDSKVKQVEMGYQYSLSTNPKLHYRAACAFSKWGKELFPNT